MGDTPILFSTHIFVSSLINKAIYKGLAAFTGIPFFEEAHFRHLNQPDLYIETVEGAFDPSCKRRRPGTKRRSDWSRKEERLKQKQGVISKPYIYIGLNTCQKTQKISYARRLRPTLMLRGYRKESHWKSKRKAITFWILGSRERLTHVIYDFASVLALLAKGCS